MAFVMEKHEKWLKFNHMEGTIMEALDMLNELASNSAKDISQQQPSHQQIIAIDFMLTVL